MANVTMDTWCHRGTLYCEGQSTAEGTTDATPRQIVGPTFSKKGESGLTVDTTNDYITIVDAGDYLVAGSISFSGTGNKTYKVSVYSDTSTDTNISFTRKLGTGGDVGSASIGPAVITLAAGDDVCLFHSSTDGGSAFTAAEVQLSVVKLSDA